MEKILHIVHKKPSIFLGISIGYLLIVSFLKWRMEPPAAAIFFLIGGTLGIYFLDAAEEFFRLSPSPFRSVVFAALMAFVGFFIVTSSGSALASGLVLSLYLQLILVQVGEWKAVGNLESWYRLIAAPVPHTMQRTILSLFIGIFVLETFLFVR